MDNGFNSPTTDEPLAGNPRVHEEGRQNYERNNRSSDWFAHSNEVLDVKSEARIKSESAKAHAEKSHESTQEDLRQNHTITSNSQDVKPEAPDSVKKEDVNSHIENHSSLEVTPKSAPKLVKNVEAEEHGEREHSSYSGSVSNGTSAAALDLELPPSPRLTPSGSDNVVKHKGELVVKSNGSKTPKDSKQGRLHQQSAGSGWDQSPPHHRLRADGEGIARRNKTDSMTDIIEQNSPDVKEPKIVVKNVPDTYTPRKPPQPRIRPDGLKNLQKSMNHSEMSAIMHGSPVESAPPRPSSGRKILPHMQRSELW